MLESARSRTVVARAASLRVKCLHLGAVSAATAAASRDADIGERNALSIRVRLRHCEAYRAALPRATQPPLSAAATAPAVSVTQSRRRTSGSATTNDDVRHRVALVWPFDGTLRYCADVPLPQQQVRQNVLFIIISGVFFHKKILLLFENRILLGYRTMQVLASQ